MAEAGAFGVEAGVDLSNGATERQDRDRTADVAPHRQQALDGALRVLERCQGRDTRATARRWRWSGWCATTTPQA
jgi:hypothetical protein